MARLTFREKDEPSVKKLGIPTALSRKHDKMKKYLYVSLTINIILALTTLYMICG